MHSKNLQIFNVLGGSLKASIMSQNFFTYATKTSLINKHRYKKLNVKFSDSSSSSNEGNKSDLKREKTKTMNDIIQNIYHSQDKISEILKANKLFEKEINDLDLLTNDNETEKLKSRMNVLYNRPQSPSSGAELERLLIKNTNKFHDKRKRENEKVYTQGFIEETYTPENEQGIGLLNHREYNPIKLRQTMASEGEIREFRNANRDTKILGKAVEDYFIEELDTQPHAKELAFLENDKKLEVFDSKNNIFTEFSDDDLEHIAEAVDDPDYKESDDALIQNFKDIITGNYKNDEFFDKFIADNSFVKSRGKSD